MQNPEIERHEIVHPLVTETLHEFPNLRFLLGKVSIVPNGTDSRPDNTLRPVYYLQEGSGMFGLTIPDDAMRWRGIFNHIMGTSRQVYWLADRLSHLSSDQIQMFGELGYDTKPFVSIHSEELRDFMFVSHAGRRRADERIWHDLHDSAHPTADIGMSTYRLLEDYGASQRVLDLMRVETNAKKLVRSMRGNHFPNLEDNILTYCDWTFDQLPTTLTERFVRLRQSKRTRRGTLYDLQRGGAAFEKALKEIVDPDIFRKMTHAGPYDWETKIRRAYSASAGLPLGTVFPWYTV